MTIHEVEQRSEAWRQLRLGRLTASVAKDIFERIKSGEAAKRRDLRLRLVTERLTGVSQENGYVSPDMAWGTDHEDEARGAYEAATGNLVTLVGFCQHDTLAAGCSPDGFIEPDGLLSLKCPKSATLIRYWRDGGEPSEHVAQNTHELLITGRTWLDFAAYDPRLPEALQLFVVRVTRTPLQLADHEHAVRAFLSETDLEEAALRTMCGLKDRLQEAVNHG